MSTMQHLIHKLAAETGGSEPTIRKWLADPSSVLKVHDYAFTSAVKALKLQEELEEVRKGMLEAAGT